MKKEQIIKALECCASEKNICTECPIDEKIKADCECGKLMSRNALALIKELTEENKRIWAAFLGECDLSCCPREKEITSATVKKMQEKIKERIKGIYLDEQELSAIIDEITDEILGKSCVPVPASWGFDGLGWSCSCCNEYPVPGQADPHKPMIDICPNCEAIMENADKTAKECLCGGEHE